MKTVELRKLEYFVAVAEERHFGRAAERLKIAQPGLSQQIRALERSLGVQLFIRDSRGVGLTEAGGILLEHARVAIEATARAVESVRLVSHRKSGLLKVGTHVLGNPPFINELLTRFESRFPEVQLETRPSLALQGLEALGRHEIDVAVLPAPFPARKDLRYLPLGELEILVAVPCQHRLAQLDPIPRDELLHEPVLVWPRSVNPTLIDHLRRSMFGASGHPPFVEISDFPEASRMQHVTQGRGVAMVLAPTAQEHFPDVVFRRIADPAPTMEVGLAWFDLHVSSFVPSFVDLARELSRSRD